MLSHPLQKANPSPYCLRGRAGIGLKYPELLNRPAPGWSSSAKYFYKKYHQGKKKCKMYYCPEAVQEKAYYPDNYQDYSDDIDHSFH